MKVGFVLRELDYNSLSYIDLVAPNADSGSLGWRYMLQFPFNRGTRIWGGNANSANHSAFTEFPWLVEFGI